MVEKAIKNILDNTSGLNTVDKYFAILPEKRSSKYLVYYRNSTEPNDTKTGRSTLDEAVIQINIFCETALECANIAEKVRGALDRYSGTANEIKVQSIQFTNELNMFEFNEIYNSAGNYQITQFYQIRVEPVYQ